MRRRTRVYPAAVSRKRKPPDGLPAGELRRVNNGLKVDNLGSRAVAASEIFDKRTVMLSCWPRSCFLSHRSKSAEAYTADGMIRCAAIMALRSLTDASQLFRMHFARRRNTDGHRPCILNRRASDLAIDNTQCSNHQSDARKLVQRRLPHLSVYCSTNGRCPTPHPGETAETHAPIPVVAQHKTARLRRSERSSKGQD